MMAIDDKLVVFQTDRLPVQRATVEDADLFYALWTDPAVMKNVGFPHGLPITRREIEEQLKNQGAGGIRADTGKLLIPQAARTKSVTVEYTVYRIYRRIWQKAQRQAERAAKDVG